MGLFDHLFKPRPEGTLERVVEAPLKASGLVEFTPAEEGEAPPDPATAFLQPKGYSAAATSGGIGVQNQGFVPVLPAAKRAPAPERKPPASADASTAGARFVVLTVGDVLGRIPVAFLRPGPHDLKRELRFHVEDLASDITRGRPAIALSCIAEQCPEIFHAPITDAEDMAIRLPLQKLVEQVSRLQGAHSAPTSPVVLPPPRPTATPVVEKPRPEPPPAPPVLKVAERVAPPPIAPPPVAPPPVVIPTSAPVETPVIPPKIVPPPPVETVLPPAAEVAPSAPVAEPLLAAEIIPPPAAPPPAAEQAPVESVPTTPEEPLPVSEPAPVEAAVEPAIAAAEPAEVRPSESSSTDGMIHLGLAAIVAKLPREMVAEPPPRIEEGLRISLPFAMIERQLGTGVVEIPSRLFWIALPPLLKHYFVAREGLVVQLPLEEIFQNLPVGGVEEKPWFEPLAPPSPLLRGADAPIVLAPAPVEDETPPLGLDLSPPMVAPMPAAEPVSEPPAEPAPIEVAPPPVAEVAPEPEPVVVIEEVPVAAVEAAPLPVPAPASEAPATTVLAPVAPQESQSASAVNAPPAHEQPAFVHLQPFRVFHPPTPTVVESESGPERTDSVVLGGNAGEPATPTEASQVLVPSLVAEAASEPAEVKPDGPQEAAGAAPAPVLPEAPHESAPSLQAVPPPVAVTEPEIAPPVAPPEPEPLVAFSPDQPPPLKIEEPAAAVAVLRATVPAPLEAPAAAMATVSVSPPRIFRPTVLPPRIAGFVATPPVNFAPTLAGPATLEAGMISLSPMAEVASPQSFETPVASPEPPQLSEPVPPPAPVAPVPPPSAPPADPPAAQAAPSVTPPPDAPPKIKNLVRRLFASPSTPEQPEPTPASPTVAEKGADPAPASAPSPDPVESAVPAAAPPPVASAPPSAPVETAESAPAAFHLHIPPLPQPQAASSAAPEFAPPSLPISRFDQHSLQSLFMTDENLDLPKISRLAASLPGIQACIITARGESFSSGQLPAGFQMSALRGLSPQVGAAADRLPIGELKNFTLYGEQYSVSFFERPAVCLCAIHRARSFVPGVREKLVAVVDELARV